MHVVGAQLRTNSSHWKKLSAALTVVSLFLGWRLYRQPTIPSDAAPVVDRKAIPTSQALSLRQLRIPAAALGLDERQLIRQLRSTTNPNRITLLTKKLGFVGSDLALEALMELAEDARPVVSRAAIEAIGQIGTTAATRFLLATEKSASKALRETAIAGLGFTGADSARERLVAIAADDGDPAQARAIQALTTMADDDVVALFKNLAEVGSYNIRSSVISALGKIGSDASEAALATLADIEQFRGQGAGDLRFVQC